MRRSRSFCRSGVFAALAIGSAVLLLGCGSGQGTEDQAFFHEHISDVFQIEPTRLNDPSFLKVFSSPVYSVKAIIKQSDGEDTNNLVVARIGDKLVSVSQPTADGDLPDFPKMLNPDFKLKSDKDAKALQQAMDLAYPITDDNDKRAEAVRHGGSQWMLIRGVSPGQKLGYIFDVDSEGVIKSVRFTLKLPEA